jgi:hypothetical protein
MATPDVRAWNVGDQVTVIYNGYEMPGVVLTCRLSTNKYGWKRWMSRVRFTNKAGKAKVREFMQPRSAQQMQVWEALIAAEREGAQ